MKIIFKGTVQGVGFRPTIYRVAQQQHLNGYVLNKGSEVEVVVDRNANQFITQVQKELPSIAQITSIEKFDEKIEPMKGFHILHSTQGSHQSHIPADISICKSCQQELFDKTNRRYLFPFTNCTLCGARYSITTDVPYDRERTAMNEFSLCKQCTQEYKKPENRRYHAQTISCPICGPKYTLFDKNKKILGEKHEAIIQFAHLIDEGNIGVIKSWGGMHLCCTLDQITRFRKWYNRPQKAFAIMAQNLQTAKQFGNITEHEEELLKSKEKPIVLINKKNNDLISPGLNTIGLFLPYTGLHHILFSQIKDDALIMTSANIPDEPMLTQNEDAFALNADMYLLHNRKIPNRVDDSVLRVWKNSIFFLRKSRGYVPNPLPIKYSSQILSVGGGENICGAVSTNKQLYATQYIGNSEYYQSLDFLDKSLHHLLQMVMQKPGLDAIAMDLHPGYETRMIAKKIAEEYSASLSEIQHHWAHAASLLVDNKIDEQSVILTLDGLGYGEDATFWGGEVLSADLLSYNRIGHLETIPILGGDMATKDPRRLVYAIFQKNNQKKMVTEKEAEIFEKMISHSPVSSSLGRILDAVSCYLGICTKRTYDGEPAMKLEKYLAAGKPTWTLNAQIKNGIIQTSDLFFQIDRQLHFPLSERQKADAAVSLVQPIICSLTDIAIQYAKDHQIKTIGVTGGCSYNVPIMNMIHKQVQKTSLKLLTHNQVPNGDGGIAIGQNAIAGYQVQ